MIEDRISAARMSLSETASTVVTNKEGNGRNEQTATCVAALSAVCVGCRHPIRDQYMLHVDPGLDWHTSCLRCAECSQPLDESCTCFVREGRAYCKPDYTRLFGVKCARCGLGFDKINLVMRACERIYHIDCFRCVTCQRQLVSGDEFALRASADGALVCRDHYDLPNDAVDSTDAAAAGAVVLHRPLPPVSSAADLVYGASRAVQTVLDALCVDIDVTSPSSSLTTSTKHQNTSASASSDTDVNSKLSHPGNSPQPNITNVGGGKKQATGSATRHVSRVGKSDTQTHQTAKTTRIRTVLNEKQLHTLRTCYAANPRPDALMKDQLVEMTGLSSRVIRVWFQNKRCKDKKRTILIKQLQQQHQDKVLGVPMIASSPIRMQDQNATMLQASAIQIHHQYVQQNVLSSASQAASVALHDGESNVVPPPPGTLGAPPSMPWSGAGPGLPATVVDYSGLQAACTTPTLMVGDMELDRAAGQTTAAFQQLLESFGCQSDFDDDVDDDSVVNVDEKTPPLLARNAIKPTRSLNKLQHQPKLPPIVQPQHHAVCSAARC